MLVVSCCVIPLAILQLQPWLIDPHRDPAKFSIARGIGAVITEQVVHGHVLLYTAKNLAKIVGVEIGAAAGVDGERDQRLLRGEIGVQIVECRLS